MPWLCMCLVLVRARVQSCVKPGALSARVPGEAHSTHNCMQGAALGSGVRGSTWGSILILFGGGGEYANAQDSCTQG